MKVNDKDCNFTSTFKAKVTLSKKEWLEKEQEITTNVEKKVAGGSPKKTYDTFDDLKLAEPEGDQAPVDGYDGTRLVKTNTDKLAHWYYFDNITKTWEDGGIYIAGDLDQYAKVDGSYEELEAGSAKTISSRPVIDESSYISRETYNGAEFDEGPAKLLAIKGNTQKCYQLWDEQWENGTLNENGQPVENADYIRSREFIKVSPQATYFITCNYRVQIYFYDVNKNKVGSTNVDDSSFGTTYDTAYMKFYVDNTAYGNVYKNDIMLNEGSIRKPYEPYYEGLRSAKPTKLVSTGTQVCDDREWENKLISETGEELVNPEWITTKNFSKIVPNKTYSLREYAETQPDIRIAYYDSNKQFIRVEGYPYQDTITPNYSEEYIKVGLNFKTYNKDLMLNIGTEPKPYEPYKENILEIAPEIQKLEGYGLGTNEYKNELDLTNKKFIRKVTEFAIDNTLDKDAFRIADQNDISIAFICYGENKSKLALSLGLKNKEEIASNNFRTDLNPWINTINENCLYLYRQREDSIINTLIIRIKKSLLETLDVNGLFKYLETNPIKVVYPIKDIETIDLPVVQDDKFVAYNGGTETWEGTQVPVPTKIAYASALVKKLVALPTRPEYDVKQLEQDNRIKALEERLAQLEARVTALEPAPTNEGEI